MSKRINFTTLVEAQRLIQADKNKLFLVGYGVVYIPPTYQSLLYLQEYGKDPGLDHQDKVKVCLIDQESHRDFCDENQLVVGTPVLQMYYNGKIIRFRFLKGDEQTIPDETKSVNVYIGQFHYTTIHTLVHFTFNAIQQYNDNAAAGDVVVDVLLDQLYETGGGDLDESGSEFDSETDSGEDSDIDDTIHDFSGAPANNS